MGWRIPRVDQDIQPLHSPLNRAWSTWGVNSEAWPVSATSAMDVPRRDAGSGNKQKFQQNSPCMFGYRHFTSLFALSKGPSSKTIHKIKPWVQLHPFIKHYGSRWVWSGSQQRFILSDVYVSNLDVELELLLRLPWTPKNKLSLARYLIGFSCSTVDGTSSNISLKWWYTMTENEQNPPFPIKSKQCRGCPGNLPFS